MSKKADKPQKEAEGDDLQALIAKKDRERRHEKGEPEEKGEPRGRELTKGIYVIDRTSKLYVKGGLK
jgi:hypothetical protein